MSCCQQIYVQWVKKQKGETKRDGSTFFSFSEP